jgi:hypothetical protein
MNIKNITCSAGEMLRYYNVERHTIIGEAGAEDERKGGSLEEGNKDGTIRKRFSFMNSTNLRYKTACLSAVRSGGPQ